MEKAAVSTLKSTQERMKRHTDTPTHTNTKFNFHKQLFDCVDALS